MRTYIEGTKKSFFYLFFSVLAILMTLVVGTQKADAALPNLTLSDPYDSVTVIDSNLLYIEDSASLPKPTISYSLPGTVTETYVTPGLAATIGEYTNLSWPIEGTTTSHYITTTYSDIGHYQESYDSPIYRIGVSVKHDNFTKTTKITSSPTHFEFRVADIYSKGFWFYYMPYVRTTYTYFWASGPNAGSTINFSNNNAFQGISSLNGPVTGAPTNGGEFVVPQNDPNIVYAINSPSTSNETNVYLTSSTGVVYSTERYEGFSNNFVDQYNNITFHRNAVSVPLFGTSNTFIYGTNRVVTSSGHSSPDVWVANMSFVLFRGNPGPPTKDVLDENKTSIDGEDVLREDILYYDVTQRVPIKGTSILSAWKSFSMEDTLPAEVTYQSAEVVDSTGTAISNPGTITYNSTTRELSYTANSNFLNNVLKYTGETFTLRIKVKVNADVAVKTIITNKASSNIEGSLVQETNEVSNQIPYGNLELTKVTEDDVRLANIEFSIKDKNGVEQLTATNNKTDSNGKIELQELHPGTYTITEVSVPWGYQLDTAPKTLVVKKESETAISKIEIVNYYTRFKIHLRQAVVGADNELVVPSMAYFSLDNVDSTGTSANLYNVIASSNDKHSAPITQSLFTTRVMRLDAHLGYTLMDVAHIVPEYYEYLGYTVSKTGTSLNSDHVYTSSGYVASTYPSLDYSNTLEYWVTVYIQPKYGQDDDGNPEDSPRPYSWDRVTNDFGTIKLE